jgi:hypothetical protein
MISPFQAVGAMSFPMPNASLQLLPEAGAQRTL